MAEQVDTAPGYALSSLERLGEGYGFRKLREPLGVTAFGANAIVLPEGYESRYHTHDEQEELYFVHSGTIEFRFGDGTRHTLGPGGVARVDPSMPRSLTAIGGDAVYVCVGGKDGYVGRDGRLADAPQGD